MEEIKSKNTTHGSAGVPPAKITSSHKGWYSRGYLPHFDSPQTIQMITFRLADSLPAYVMNQIETDLLLQIEEKRRKFIDRELDNRHGACYLQNPEIAELVQDAFKYFDGSRYNLIAWVVMPNHVHVLIALMSEYGMDKIIYSWKSYTAKMANRILNRKGRFWQREYWDRYIRNEEHLYRVIEYIHMNPVKAGLVENAEDWAFSSARCQMMPAGLQRSQNKK